MSTPFGECLKESGSLFLDDGESPVKRFVLTEGITSKYATYFPNFVFMNAEEFTHTNAMGRLCTSTFGSIHIDSVSDEFDWKAFDYLIGRSHLTDLKLSTIQGDVKEKLSRQVDGFVDTFLYDGVSGREESRGFEIMKIISGMTVTCDR